LQDSKRPRWLDLFEDEDVAFLKRFLFASGSLKELADAYDISYPTVRLRLDRLIEKARIADQQEIKGPFEKAARGLFADGRFDAATLKALLAAHQEEMEEGREPTQVPAPPRRRS
jgi:hypothetical protein